MLVKSVCANCGHSYLADDQAGELACPRCDVANENVRNPSDVPDAPMGVEPEFVEGFAGDEPYAEIARFDPKAPPPMFINRDRFVRGVVFGSVGALGIGAAVAAALAALGFVLPAVAAAVIGLVAGASCRYGFGGRASYRTRVRAMAGAAFCCVIGFAGFFTGAWIVERVTGSRAHQMREDLDIGLRALLSRRNRTTDAGDAALIDQRVAAVGELRALTDPEVEDYLWIQQAQVNQALLAYTKLRATEFPVVRLGPDGEEFRLPKAATLALFLGEIALAMFLATRAIRPSR